MTNGAQSISGTFFTWIVVVSLIIINIVTIVVMVIIVMSEVNSDGELSYVNQFYKIDKAH